MRVAASFSRADVLQCGSFLFDDLPSASAGWKTFGGVAH